MEPQRIAEISVSYKPVKASTRSITSSSDAYKIFIDSWNRDTLSLFEEFKVLLLNRANEVLGIYELSKGGISGTFVDIRLLFGVALKTAASSIILCHNHPSGQLKPSQQDLRLTRKIKEAGQLLDIAVLDHLIVTENVYLSFDDDGLL